MTSTSRSHLRKPHLPGGIAHLEAVIPNFLIHEHHLTNTDPANIEHCIYNYQPSNGYYSIPDLPGLGNELSEYSLSRADIVTVKP